MFFTKIYEVHSSNLNITGSVGHIKKDINKGWCFNQHTKVQLSEDELNLILCQVQELNKNDPDGKRP